MNREIKFRAYVPEDELMVYSDNCDEDDHFSVDSKVRFFCSQQVDDCYSGNHVQYDVIKEQESHIIMQFTGLKDKNGMEIYEGDIVGGYPNGTVSVRWCNESACFESFSIGTDFNDEGEPVEIEIKSLFSNDLIDCKDTWEVCGNIHQHPELLK